MANKEAQAQQIIPKIGLEIHGYLITNEKLFCKCPTDYKKAKVNTNICPICTGCPGSKPMNPNVEALKKALAITLMLECKISEEDLIWQRKHYDWPDLPKGYQDTTSGSYSIPVGKDGEFLGIRIRQVHLEEDPARWDPETGNVDYNRCGMPLVEIVTEPDFKSSKEVREWLAKFLITMAYIKSINKDAGIKADVNVSINLNGKQGERVEVKNVNSTYAIERAIDYEIIRQAEELKKGKVKRETRAFSEKMKVTISMREKEEEADYRFIPDPDLPVIGIDRKIADTIKKSLPETPHSKVKRFVKEYGLNNYESNVLSSDIELANFFEKLLKLGIKPKIAANWVTIELLRILNWNKKRLDEVDIKSEHFAELLELLDKKEITELSAKQLLNKFIPKSFSPKKEAGKISIISDSEDIEKICLGVIKKNPDAVNDYRNGEAKALNFLIGEVMKASKRRADFKTAREILIRTIH
jgi:aspartyl-tRNA(Asn)/glutamyl-tRNA(Gln) amidotransferase subunit B